MRILVVNDDGIKAEGIIRLARAAQTFGEVWVVAPKHQCSAMSSRITLRGEIAVEREGFPVEDITAYSVDGTPADCVKIALTELMPEKPDIVFSGINHGFNAGIDIQYSGTVGAAMEALLNGIPAIAFSSEVHGSVEVVEEYLVPIAEELLKKPLPANEIWNVNFPGCTLAELKGVRRDCVPAQTPFYRDHFQRVRESERGFVVSAAGIPVTTPFPAETDAYAIQNGYISVGTIRSMILVP